MRPATLCYCSFIGWLVAFAFRRSTVDAFHLRQTMFLYVLSLSLYGIDSVLEIRPEYGGLLYPLLYFLGGLLFVLWAFGLVAAVNGLARPMPLIGRKAQEVFQGIQSS
ncbi:MAG TPA: hypothetical protein VL547_22885 [Dinghuibacter sp.]|uniref:hypothetical protein n=1 Tax=Dinghuibacter sp. TaxID=2024697 RepID=UPI002C6B3E13|nr:hypothetical protein [Dinghuibacter sp.]HTJ14909.1 hypothetical protein [Dinghuibacter sp.]